MQIVIELFVGFSKIEISRICRLFSDGSWSDEVADCSNHIGWLAVIESPKCIGRR